ncbi:MAG: hypothetical protein GKS05_01590 [Nitrospirales bacterium]|nr:hypothetical protein [Nitrospirales bacterium]
MKLGPAKMSVGIGLHVFDEYLAELYHSGKFPKRIAENRETPLGLKHTTIKLEQPRLELRGKAQNNNLRTSVLITGVLKLRPEGKPKGPIEFESPFSFYVRLDIVLKPVTNNAPTLGLVYSGVDGDTGGLISNDDVDSLFEGPSIASLINGVKIDILSPIVSGLGALFFDDNRIPKANRWSTTLRLMPGKNPGTQKETVDAIGIFVNVPGSYSDPGKVNSHLPKGMGLGVAYSREMLDFVFAKQAQEQVGTRVNGAKIKSLTLKMSDTGLYVNGRAEKDSAEITFKGPIAISMTWGYTSIGQDTSKVSVDVDLPWYADILPYVAGVFFFIPGLNILNLWIIPLVYDIDQEKGKAPDTVRSGLSGALTAGMAQLASGLKIDLNEGDIAPYSIPNHLTVKDGNLGLYAEVIVSPFTSRISKAAYSRSQRKFSVFTLKNGRRFRVKDLVYLMEIGRITCPGHHAVGGRYIRANPDGTASNNLLEIYGPA